MITVKFKLSFYSSFLFFYNFLGIKKEMKFQKQHPFVWHKIKRKKILKNKNQNLKIGTINLVVRCNCQKSNNKISVCVMIT
jgi:hypothetical protein